MAAMSATRQEQQVEAEGGRLEARVTRKVTTLLEEVGV